MLNIFNKLFGNDDSTKPQPNLKFGRYSDSYKMTTQYDYWDKALEAFEKERYLDSYRAFFKYLSDEREKNVNFWEKGNKIHFEIFQGSKKVSGVADRKKFSAEAKVAHTKELNIGFLRRLVEANYDLKYSRFALDNDNNITILFDTYTLDGSPYKLYYALKEVARNADKQDDLLLDEFDSLQPVDSTHLKQLTDEQKEAKYQFIQKEIQEVFNEIDNGKLKADQYPGAMAYLMLNLNYKLDYLIKPEGFIMETLERIHRKYFSNEEESTIKRNLELRKEFQKLLDRPKEEVFKEMYEVPATFGITSPVNHDKIVSFIDGELHNMDWYKEHHHYKVALSIPSYIAGYCQFYYAAPKPDRALFHLYFQIVEADYFKSLGFTTDYYNPKSGKFNEKRIKRAIKNIVEKNQEKYFRLNPNLNKLRFDSIVEFAKSYLLMIRELDMTKRD